MRAIGRRRFRGAPRPDDGLSLAEVLVAMTVTALLAALAGQIVGNSMRSARFSIAKTSTAANARSSVDRMTRVLRATAPPYAPPSGTAPNAFEAARYDGATFYAALKRDNTANDPIPTKIRYYWNTTTKCLTEESTPGQLKSPAPTSGSPYEWLASATRSSCLLRMRTGPTAATPMFGFYSSAALDSSGESAATKLPMTSGAVATADLSKIMSVEISVSADDGANPTMKPVRYVDKVTLGNLVINAGGRA